MRKLPKPGQGTDYKMSNAYTKMQIRQWLDEAIKKAQSPDPREKMRRERMDRIKKVSKNYGL